MSILQEPTYRETTGQLANHLAGHGFVSQKLPDLAEKLALVRAMVGVSPHAWPDSQLSFLMLGDSQSSPPGFNRRKKGEISLAPEDASVLAQTINFLMSDIEAPKICNSATMDQAARYIRTVPPGNSGLRAIDLTRPVLEFAGRLAAAMKSGDQAWQDTLHDRVMAHLNGLREKCTPDVAVVIQRRRERVVGKSRFGDQQKPPKQKAWELEPWPAQITNEVDVGLPFKSDKPLELWAFTIRDPRPPVSRGERIGTYVWDTPWSDLLRWTPGPEIVEASNDLAISYGKIIGPKGLYHIYVLADVPGKNNVYTALGEENLAPGRVSMHGFYRLLEEAMDLSVKSTLRDVRIFTRSYRIAG